MKICKFGGTSMANAETITLVKNIIKNDPERRVVVVSAPGKRNKEDEKVTDLLYSCIAERDKTGKCDNVFEKVENRFNDIIKGLNLSTALTGEFSEIKKKINGGADSEYTASRGEYLCGIITAAYLGYEFIDAAEVVKFFDDGQFNPEYTNDMLSERLKNTKGAVIPGFYGKTPGGKIKTFSRGGSDVTGALVARAINASVYENWTDVDGFLTCDPRIVKDAAKIELLSYRELRELSYMGANVLHPESIFPVQKSDIPINIKNTFNPEYKGTLIVPVKDYTATGNTVTGIAGKKGFMSITIEKAMMNNELGFARKVLTVLEHYNVSLEHMPSGVDTLSVVVDKNNLNNNLDSIINRLDKICAPDKINVEDNLSLIATVGHGMRRKTGTAGKIFDALTKADVNIRMIDQGSSELNIIVGVSDADYEKAINAIYAAMVAA